MTNEEKHALIESVLFNHPWRKHSYVIINGRRADIETWLDGLDSPDSPSGGTTAGQTPPNYSSNLNLCAAAESRILKANLQEAYKAELSLFCPDPESVGSREWWLIAAPPQARVAAMVAVIQERAKTISEGK